MLQVLCRYQQDKNAAIYEASEYNQEGFQIDAPLWFARIFW